MLFSSDDDDLPTVPTVEIATPPTSSLSPRKRADRFHQLEEMHRDLQKGATPGRRREGRAGSGSQADNTAAPAAAPTLGVWSESEEAAFYELRTLAPHLSPYFACSYSDAVLLIAAIRSGGAATSERQSLADRCQTLEADRRLLEQHLSRSREECDTLQSEVAAVKQKLKAVQEETKGSVAVLAQRREEMRKQLLLEETRSEKVKVRNKKLEAENDALKERLRDHLR